MPIVFLSPSTQDWNPYVTGSGSEEYWMNRIVDAMEPYLRSNGIRYRLGGGRHPGGQQRLL